MSEPGHHAQPWVRLSQLLGPERRDIFGIVIFAFAVAVLSLATPIAVEALVNTVAFGVLIWPIVVIAMVLLACLGLAAAIRAMQIYIVECIQRRLFVRVVADYAYRLPRTQLEAFDRRYGPELANRFFDVVSLQKSVAYLLLEGVALVVTAGVGMVVLAFYHPFLLGFDIVLLATIAFILFVLGYGGVSSSLNESQAKYRVAAWIEELARGTRAAKSHAGQELAQSQAEDLTAEYIAARKNHFRVVWRQTVFALGLQVVASTALLGLGGYLVVIRQLTLGQLVASELIVALVVASASKLGKYAETYYDLMASSEKLGQVTDLPLEQDGREPLLKSGRGATVRIDGIGVPPVSWRIESGERVAVVTSKDYDLTELLETVAGFRRPAIGVVEVDQIDVREARLNDWREQVILVSTAEVIAGTILENMRITNPAIGVAEVRTALEAVGMMEVVHRLPLGLDTPLLPGGKPLTAPQTLKLTLARAIASQPRLLILDGVLDGLNLADSPGLMPLLLSKVSPWTLIIVTSHRDMAERCDRPLRPLPPAPTPVAFNPVAGALS